jgi:hypothetical protein|tara:strand:- start:44 stop:274 length:231 start_codon:yes stop_codon:yes gene_type:complete
MSPLQPMIWALIVVGFIIAARWIISRPPGPMFSRHADRMTAAANHMWMTGDCFVCGGCQFDHADDCDLHLWLGGDA